MIHLPNDPMRQVQWIALAGSLLALNASGLLSTSTQVVSGSVRDRNGPVAGARVRFQGDCAFVLTDKRGMFELRPSPGARRIVAWKDGYTIAAATSKRPELLLTPLPARDHDDYAWVAPDPDKAQANNCGNCHETIYREWAGSAHASAASNRHVLNLLAGTDWNGQPSKGWNLPEEHPLGKGVCATCHAPTFSDPRLDYDLAKVKGVAAQGVHCDYCHKVVDAPVDKLGTRFGKDGLKLLRPPQKEQLFFGPLDDAVREGEAFAYSPLYQESRYCASCHEGVVFGTHAYGTYSEWLASPARHKGQQCQTCHMAPTGKMTNIAPGKGGIERDPKTLGSHGFPGGQADMLKRCLDVQVRVEKAPGGMRTEVWVRADDVGHRVPTGFIDRHLLLVVEAWDAENKAAPLIRGPTLPAAAGKRLAGQPGLLYAKQLKGQDDVAPVPFWLPHEKVVDTRLLPGHTDRQTFVFGSHARKTRVRLLYRRFWQDIADAKNWPNNEITVADRTVP
jgi:hypothetical protein